MATYKGIQGYSVQKLSSDPTVANTVGQLWYNSTSGKFKIAVAAAGAWASGGALNTGTRQMGLTGIQTAAIKMSGGNTYILNCETYNGSTWTEVADVNTGADYNVAFGTSAAAVYCGGNNPSPDDKTETWNNTSWSTSPGTMNTARMKMSAANQGTTTDGLIFAGMSTPAPTTPGVQATESWNGTSWAVEANLITGRSAGGGGGTSTAAFLASGYRGPAGMTTVVETWNGTSWTEVNPVNSARQGVGSSGTTTSALLYAGTVPPVSALTEQWNGTSWTEVGDLATAREGVGKGTGIDSDTGLCVGFDGSPNTIVEEWTGAPVTAKTVTVS